MSKTVPYSETEHEIVVHHSRFIASLAPVSSVDEARSYIKAIKERFPDATHHVPAYLIGHGNSVTAHCNDDGEPSGTAGRPALAVLQGSGMGDVVVVVTRYFGGTKLGTGGLVRAYGEAVREVLKKVKIAEIIDTSVIKVALEYSHYEPVKRLLPRYDAEIEGEDFSEHVSLLIRSPVDQREGLECAIIELTAARASISIVSACEEARKLAR